MKGVILFSLGLVMLLLALSCDAKACSQNSKTTSGKCCSIPFRYKGVTYNSCTKVAASRPWCSYNRYYKGKWGYCEPKVDLRVRKDFTSMTSAERRDYLRAVKKVSTAEPYKTDYKILLAKHRTLFSTDIHSKKHFLTWHRWFALQYENILRRVDSHVTLPYWDWSSSNAFDTSSKGVWNSYNGFGGDGAKEIPNCVQTGPFREGEWSLVPPMNGPCTSDPNNCTCLARKFGALPTEKDVQNLLAIPAYNFTDFEITLRNVLHFYVHKGVGGTMFTENSASAPEFFLVHAFVDKIWNDWQQKSCAHKYAFLYTVDEYMTGTTTMPYEVIDVSSLPGDVKVEYQNNAAKRRRGQSLIERPRIPRELDPKIIELFKVSPEEVKKIKEMSEESGQRLIERRRIPGEVDPKIIELFKVSPEEVKKIKEMPKELARRENNDYHY